MQNPKLKNLLRPTKIAILAMFPLLMAAKGEGCGGNTDDGQITPDLTATWDLEYDDNLEVEIVIGGAVYTETIGLQGGLVTIDHNGTPIEFDLDCSRQEVVCPSEVWASNVDMDQRDKNFPRNVYVTIPVSECDGSLIEPDPSECGPDTNNEECNKVCDGTVTVEEKEAFGRISLDDDELTVLLGAGIATNGINCALLGLSVANSSIETTGTAAANNCEGTTLPDGEVITAYAGGCLWAGDPDDDGTIEALVIGGSVTFRTGFSGTRR